MKIECRPFTNDKKDINVNFSSNTTINEFNKIVNDELQLEERGLLDRIKLSYGNCVYFLQFPDNERRSTLGRWFEKRKKVSPELKDCTFEEFFKGLKYVTLKPTKK